MCGLNGIYAYHDAASQPSEAELLRTRDAMAARGPDGAGAWWSEDRRVALGHRRLSIIDLSDRAAQPMTSEDGRLTVTFNGEIYNCRELQAELAADGHRFRTSSDTEVLLHLYAREGRAMVRRLRGMFAFAIRDGAAGTLLLARDPYGIKPLYYANDGWTLRFASQVKALLAGGAISREPEPAGIVGFQLWGHVPEPFSVYRDIRSVPAGHTMLVDRWGPREPRRYASVAEVLAETAARPVTDRDERARRIADAVRTSVRAHLLADVDVGVFLSAGIDSGAVLGLLRDVGVARPRAVTLSFAEFRGTPEDETPLAARVAARYEAEHTVRTVDEAEFTRDLPRILDAMDQPSMDGINTWFVAKAAHEAGLKVALSGVGGDELLGGYTSFTDIPQWRRRYGWAARIPGAAPLSRMVLRRLFPGLVSARPKAAYMLDHAAGWEGCYLLRRGLMTPGELSQVLDPDLIREGMRRLRPLERLRATLRPDPGSDLARVGALESTHYLRDQLLRDADWAGMAHSVEIRTPLVDFSLLREVAPVLHGLERGEGKRALALSPQAPLPAEVTERAKTGFGVPIGAWMNSAAGAGRRAGPATKGLVSRAWAQTVLTRSTAALSGTLAGEAEAA